MNVYLDHAATTPVDPKVERAMRPFLSKDFGNASSLHSAGRRAKKALEESRETIAKSINAKPEEIYFTSGGTESNNLALKGIAFADRKRGKHIITAQIEHDCVMNSAKWLEKNGFKVTYLGVDREGFVDANELDSAIRKDTILVSVMHANNEIGTVQDIKKLGEICASKEIPFHTDACQSYTKEKLDVEKQNIGLATINAHKIHGPKGIGALFVRKGTRIEPIIHGGNHERGLRSGTENIQGIAGFAEAVRIAKQKDAEKMAGLRDYLIGKLSKIPDSKLNGPRKKRLANNAHFSFSFIEGESIVLSLSAEGVMASTGSACSSNSLEPSHVLKAIGLPPEISHGSLRLSLGKGTTKKEIDYASSKIRETVGKLREMSPLGRGN